MRKGYPQRVVSGKRKIAKQFSPRSEKPSVAKDCLLQRSVLKLSTFHFKTLHSIKPSLSTEIKCQSTAISMMRKKNT